MRSTRLLIPWFMIFFSAQLNWAQSVPAKTSERTRLSGYTAQSSKVEREWEKKSQARILRDPPLKSPRRIGKKYGITHYP